MYQRRARIRHDNDFNITRLYKYITARGQTSTHLSPFRLIGILYYYGCRSRESGR